MTQWATFVGITGVVLVLLLVLSHLTQASFSESDVDVASSSDSGSAVESGDDRSTADSSGSGEQQIDSGDVANSADPADPADPEDPADPVDPADSTATDHSELDHSLLPGTDTDIEPDDPRTEPESAAESESKLESKLESESESNADSIRIADRSQRQEARTDADRTTESGYGPPGKYGSGGDIDPADLTTGMVLANVAISQGLFALVLLGAVLYTAVPADALGVEFSLAYVQQGLVLGTAAGVVLYLANEIGAAAATRFGFDHDEQLRELLAPDTLQGWAVLLGVVLPIIAVFEELLFRAALIGVISAGYGVDPWLLAVVSSVAFALGHGMQGTVGVVVTGGLGFVLAAIFIVSGSFLVVVVAHYLINALEFVVHEWLEFEWAAVLEGKNEADGADTAAGAEDVDPERQR